MNPGAFSRGPFTPAIAGGKAGRNPRSVSERIRIVLYDLPSLVTDMLRETVALQPDMVIVGTAATQPQLLAVVRVRAAHVVVAGIASDDLSSPLLRLLTESPRVKVVAIKTISGSVHLFEMRPRRVDFGDIPPSEMVRVIRSSGGPAW